MAANFEVILTMTATIVGFMTSTIAFIAKYFKARSSKKIAEHNVEIRDNLLNLIIEAEKFIAKTGEEKKAYVMKKIEQFSQENNVTFNAENIGKKIDEIIALTKQVNVKRK